MSNAQILKNSTLLQLYARAAAPNRDYYGLTIAESCICLDIWKVTRGRHVVPKQKFIDKEDFKHDKYLQDDIKRSFGPNVHEYILNLSNNKRKMENLPQKIFLNIIKYLSVNDVLKLARTNKIFYELCNAESIWELLFKKVLKRKPSSEERMVAYDFGWKEALKRRMVFVRKAAALRAIRSQPVVTPTRSIKSTNAKKPPILPKKVLLRAK